MQRKSKNKGLFRFLKLSIVLFICLAVFLQISAVINKQDDKKNDTKSDEQQEVYYFPIVSTKRVTVSHGDKVTPEMFIKSVESIYDVSYSYQIEPDLEKYGVQDVVVVVTDAVGNSAAVKTRLNILNLKDRVEINIGDSLPEAEDFLVQEGSEIRYFTDISGIDTNVAGEYDVFVIVDDTNVQTTLCVADYVAPMLVMRDAEEWLNHPVPAEAFVESVTDYSEQVDIQYKTEPDWELPGEQQVTILATDANGNVTEGCALLSLREDIEAPVVSAGNLDITVGGVAFYQSAVTYIDNASPTEKLTLQVDNSEVNLNEVGSYNVVYTVTDFAGNFTTVSAKVNVVEQNPLWNDSELLYAKATEVLDEILKPDMSDYEKAEAIFNWVHKNVRFINFSEKDNYARGAYEGMFLKEGDCFVYAATSKYLLTLAEVPNLDIKKSSNSPSHYWNLVYIDTGWYHFDTCPTREGVKVFLYTDAQLEAFSSSRGNSHVYDKSLYPEIK